MPGLAIVIPGVLFWVALIYSGLGTLAIHWVGRSLVPLYFAQQRFEANFRFGLARAREYSEQIALLQGEENETAAAGTKFESIFDNYMRIVTVRKRLTALSRFYFQASVFIPYVVAAPFYFLGKITLGALNQVGAAFSSVNDSLNFFVSYYVGLADFKATLNRLSSFDEAIARAQALSSKPRHIDFTQSPNADRLIQSLRIDLPGGRPLARVDNLAFAAAEPALVVGPSGSGKSTLFRAIAGIWPFGEGTIGEPNASLMLLPQRPYIPIGSLRAAIAYPAPPDAFSDAKMREALIGVGLPDLEGRLDEDDNWQMRLSGGEQQRLAVARALLAAPDWLFLDEATSALDEASEAQVYNAIARALPKTTLVSIGHRSTLAAFHKRRIEMLPQKDGPALVREVETSGALPLAGG